MGKNDRTLECIAASCSIMFFVALFTRYLIGPDIGINLACAAFSGVAALFFSILVLKESINGSEGKAIFYLLLLWVYFFMMLLSIIRCN